MKKIGVIANSLKPHMPAALDRLVRKAGELGLELFSCDDACGAVRPISPMSVAAVGETVDALIALGGDGTVLRAVRLLNGRDIPVLGVNLGGLGFMTSVPEADLEKALDGLVSGSYYTSTRTLASCRVMSGGELLAEYQALNDIAIGWGESPRVVTLAVSIDGEDVASYSCDGVIISTPTGSTGHSLAAGGPIIHPETAAFVVSPICPHTLSNRPLVIPDKCEIAVRVQESVKQLLLTADGQSEQPLAEGDWVSITRSPHTARFIHQHGYSYFALLRQKLHWRGSSL